MKYLTIILQNYQDHENQRMWNCHRPEEVETWQLDTVWFPGQDPGTENGTEVEQLVRLNKVCPVVDNNVPMLIFHFDKCTVVIYDVNTRGLWVRGLQNSVLSLQLFFKLRLFQIKNIF